MTKPVLLIRAFDNEGDAAALEAVGVPSRIDPYLMIQPVPGQVGLEAAAKLLTLVGVLQRGDWVIATSLNGLRAWGSLAWELTRRSAVAEAFAQAQSRGVRFAAIGPATKAKFAEFGIHDVFLPSQSYGQALAEELITEAAPEAGQLNRPIRAVIPAGNLAMKTLTDRLSEAGWNLSSQVIYQTAIIDHEPPTTKAALNDEFAAVLMRSPSSARAFTHWTSQGGELPQLPVVCGGTTTAAVATQLGLNVVAVTPDTAPETIARTLKNEIAKAKENN